MAAARERLGAGADAKRVSADGARIALRDEGSGSTLVCLHSIAHGSSDFAGVVAAFRATHRVIALDWPGHGASSEDSQPPSARRYAEVALAAMDALGVERAVLIGNSIGGAAALALADAQPARVRALVLVDSGGLVPVGSLLRAVTRAMARFFSAGARGASWFPRAFAWYYRGVLPRAEARPQRDRIVAAAPEMAGVLAEAWRSFGEPAADLRAAAARLRVPVLVCWARAERVIPLRLAKPAIDRIPNVELATFPGGHAPFLECPAQFHEVLARFLASLSAK